MSDIPTPSYIPRRKRDKANLAVLLSLAGTLGGILASVFGVRIWGPTDADKATNQRIEQTNARIEEALRVIQIQSQQISTISGNQQMQSYVLCVLARRADPTLAPSSLCSSVLP